jgi:hypothetical protein
MATTPLVIGNQLTPFCGFGEAEGSYAADFLSK